MNNDIKLKSYINKLKNNKFILIKSKCAKDSHDYVNNAVYADTNILVVEKEVDKFDDLEKISNDIKLYNLNVISSVFVK